MKKLVKVIVSLASLIVTALAAYWWLKSYEMVAVLIVSIALHELGHLAALRKYGIKSSIVFVPFLGAATIPEDEDAIGNMKHFSMAMVILAGPLVNFVLMVVCIAIWAFWGNNLFWLKMGNLNAVLVAFNLLPLFGLTDGGKFMKLVYSSLDERGDKLVANLMSLFAMLAGLSMIFINKSNLFFMILYIFWRLEADKDDPADAYSRKAMPAKTVYKLVEVYALVLLVTYIFSVVLPNWLG